MRRSSRASSSNSTRQWLATKRGRERQGAPCCSANCHTRPGTHVEDASRSSMTASKVPNAKSSMSVSTIADLETCIGLRVNASRDCAAAGLVNTSQPGDLSSIHGFFRRRTSAARGGCFFRMGWARLRKLLKNTSTPRSNPPLGPDGPNAPECSRVAYPCRKAQVATAAAVSSGCPETPLAASSKSFQTAFPAPDPYLSGWRFCMTNA